MQTYGVSKMTLYDCTSVKSLKASLSNFFGGLLFFKEFSSIVIPEQLHAFLDMIFAVKIVCVGDLHIKAAVVFSYFFSLGRNRALFVLNKQFQSWTNADVSSSFRWRLFFVRLGY